MNAYPAVPPVILAMQACVKVFCTAVAPCYALPWLRGQERHSCASAVAVQFDSGELRLLTTAQVVENHTLVQVRRASDSMKYVARITCVGFDVDVAVLHVDDPAFWSLLPALPLPNQLPAIMSEVLAAGFPLGDEELSTTRGVVNRITLGGPLRELCVQTDASIPSGSAGGPVLDQHGQLVGLASSYASQTHSRMHYIIPTPVLHTFLCNAGITSSSGGGAAAAAANGAASGIVGSLQQQLRLRDNAAAAGPGRAQGGASVLSAQLGEGYRGKSTDSFRVQPLENAQLRMQLGLPARPGEGEDGGVLLTKLPKGSPSFGILEEGDVILAIDGVSIGADGTVLLPGAPDRVRVGMRYLVQRARIGQPVTYSVLRSGERLELFVIAAPRKSTLMPARVPPPKSQWLVLGGLVFANLVPEYEVLVPKCQLQRVYEPGEEGEQVVLLLRVLQAEVNTGYEDVCGMLEAFNGERVRNLAHLSTLASSAQSDATPQLEFRLVTGELLVLDALQCWTSEHDIFAVHTIPRRSNLPRSLE